MLSYDSGATTLFPGTDWANCSPRQTLISAILLKSKTCIGWDVFTQWEWGWYFHMLTNFVKQIFTPRHGTERGLNGDPTQEEITLVLLGMLLVYWSREHIKRECTHFSRNPGPCLEILQPWQDLWKRFSHNLDWKLTRIENQPKKITTVTVDVVWDELTTDSAQDWGRVRLGSVRFIFSSKVRDVRARCSPTIGRRTLLSIKLDSLHTIYFALVGFGFGSGWIGNSWSPASLLHHWNLRPNQAACSCAPVDRKDFLAEKCRGAVSRPTVSRARTALASEWEGAQYQRGHNIKGDNISAGSSGPGGQDGGK